MSTAGSLAEVHPELMKGFTALDSSSGKVKHLDATTRELIALSAGVSASQSRAGDGRLR